MLKETKDGLILIIKISPNASKNELIKTDDGVKLKITAQPLEGKANKAVIEYLSKTFRIPKTSLQIIKGETSKEKTVLIKCNNEEKLQNLRCFFNS